MRHITITVPTGPYRPGDLLKVKDATAAWFVGRGLATAAPPPPLSATAPAVTADTAQVRRPPTAGPGSGRAAWEAWCTALGAAGTSSLTRSQLIELADELEDKI